VERDARRAVRARAGERALSHCHYNECGLRLEEEEEVRAEPRVWPVRRSGQCQVRIWVLGWCANGPTPQCPVMADAYVWTDPVVELFKRWELNSVASVNSNSRTTVGLPNNSS